MIATCGGHIARRFRGVSRRSRLIVLIIKFFFGKNTVTIGVN